MNKKSIIITICFLLIVGALIALGYVYSSDLKQKNQVLQNKVGDMQKEIDKLKEFSAGLSSLHVGIDEDVATSTSNIFIYREHDIKILFPAPFKVNENTENIDFGPDYSYSLSIEQAKSLPEVIKDVRAIAGRYIPAEKNDLGNYVLASWQTAKDFVEYVVEDIGKLKVVIFGYGGPGGAVYHNLTVIGEKYNYNFSCSEECGDDDFAYIKGVIKTIEFTNDKNIFVDRELGVKIVFSKDYKVIDKNKISFDFIPASEDDMQRYRYDLEILPYHSVEQIKKELPVDMNVKDIKAEKVNGLDVVRYSYAYPEASPEEQPVYTGPTEWMEVVGVKNNYVFSGYEEDLEYFRSIIKTMEFTK